LPGYYGILPVPFWVDCGVSFDLQKPTLDGLLALLGGKGKKAGKGGGEDPTYCFTSIDSLVMVPSAQEPLWIGQTSSSNLPSQVEGGMTFDNVPEGPNGEVPSNNDAVDAARQNHGIC